MYVRSNSNLLLSEETTRCWPMRPRNPSSFAHPGTKSVKKWFEQHPYYSVRHHPGSSYNGRCTEHGVQVCLPPVRYQISSTGSMARALANCDSIGLARPSGDLVHPLSGVSTRRLSAFGVAHHATLHEEDTSIGCWTSSCIAEAEKRPKRRKDAPP